MALPPLFFMTRETSSRRAVAISPDAESQSADAELERLIRESAEGDARAFEVFYERTVHIAFSAGRRIAGDAYVEDVLADAYFQAWRDASRFDRARGSAIAWIVTIVRTRSLDRLRQESLRHGGLSGAPEFDESSIEDEVVLGPEALLEHTQSRTALHQAMSELSSNERWCLGLAYFRDHSHSEIAAITGLPLGSVKTHLSRSQQKLRLALSAVRSQSQACES
jgi:RNA polymerase sigma-70 factor (ECF subfamily)